MARGGIAWYSAFWLRSPRQCARLALVRVTLAGRERLIDVVPWMFFGLAFVFGALSCAVSEPYETFWMYLEGAVSVGGALSVFALVPTFFFAVSLRYRSGPKTQSPIGACASMAALLPIFIGWSVLHAIGKPANPDNEVLQPPSGWLMGLAEVCAVPGSPYVLLALLCFQTWHAWRSSQWMYKLNRGMNCIYCEYRLARDMDRCPECGEVPLGLLKEKRALTASA